MSNQDKHGRAKYAIGCCFDLNEQPEIKYNETVIINNNNSVCNNKTRSVCNNIM